MIANSRRHFLRFGTIAAGALLLAGCMGSTLTGRDETGPLSAPTGPVTSQPLDQPIGQGQVKVALLLPLSASGNAGNVGKSMRNAAELAVAEFTNPNIQLIVKDDAGTPQGAAQAAQAALGEGAELIIGPLFAQAVQAAGQVAKQAGKPMIAFSTDANVASRGIYLLSFLPQSDVNRIVEYASQNGRKTFAALLPSNAYGTVVEGAFQEAVSRVGGRIVGLERYPADPSQMQGAISRIAQIAASADAIFLPDAGDTVPALVKGLVAARVDTKKVMLLGSGQWDDPRIQRDPALAGGVYPAPDSSGWQAFAQRYRARYGVDPVRTSTLAYDAVLLAAALTQTQGSQRFTDQVLTNASGFQGVDGIFRFRPDGQSARGLAVMQIQADGTTRIVSPAQRAFTGASGF